MKWWLISDKDVEEIKNYLKEIPNYLNEIPSHLNGIPYMRIMVNRQKILYILDVGLHETDAYPRTKDENNKRIFNMCLKLEELGLIYRKIDKMNHIFWVTTNFGEEEIEQIDQDIAAQAELRRQREDRSRES